MGIRAHIKTLPSALRQPTDPFLNTEDLPVGAHDSIAIDLNVSVLGGTSPTVQFFWDRLGDDGQYYAIWTSAVISATGKTSTTLGPGCAVNVNLGMTGRLRWVFGGTSPTATFSGSIIGT